MSDNPHNNATTWHALAPEAALAKLDATASGLDETSAQERLHRYGPNRLEASAGRSTLARFFLQFHNILIYVLLGSAAATAFLDHLVDTGVILAVVLANVVIGFVQEGKAEKAMDAIRHMLAPQATVLRNGERRSVERDLLKNTGITETNG
jgi:magnesium-transporting ATPase (P-type)